MSLPLSWVSKIFQKLSLVYGRDFLSRWEGQNLADVMDDWAHELDGLSRNPQLIAYALQHLPADKPPTVLQFKAICNNAPRDDGALKLAAPDAKPDSELVKRMDQVREAISGIPPKQWAHRLKDREERGEKLTAAQRSMWRTALEPEAA